jgi:dCTP deaminase
VTVLRSESLVRAMNRRSLAKRLVLSPLLDDTQVGPSSVDVRLATEFRLFRRTSEVGIDPAKQTNEMIDEAYDRVTVQLGDGLWLHPGQFALGATLEYLKIPDDLSGYVIGRSSWGRIGLMVATAILVHPGYTGCLTLELSNEGDSPICIYPGVRIAQLVLHTLDSRTKRPYRPGAGKYIAHTSPRVAKLDKEQKEIAHLEDVKKNLRAVSRGDEPHGS